MPTDDVDANAKAGRFVAALGATMAAANYPTTLVALPNYVQVGNQTGDGLYIANPDFDLRYDQSFPLAQLVARAPTGTVQPEDGLAELERIRNLDKRFPVSITVLGYAIQSVGLALILQPTPRSLAGAATLGLLVGGLSVIGRRIEALGYMLPSRLVAGFMQIAQLAFGILIAVQVAGIADSKLVTTELNRLGPWAPFAGVLVYGLGIWLNFAPPTRSLPWMVLMLYVAYGGQWVGNALLGSYASGFGGGLTLILFALAVSRRPNTPPTMSLVVPGFWMLVPGSLGFMGVTQLLGTHSTAVFTATLISMMSIAMGVQTGLPLWRAAIQLTDTPDRRALHD